MPLRDQVALFEASAIAVGATGAAMTHTLWMRRGAAAILLWPTNDTDTGFGRWYRRRKQFFHGWRSLMRMHGGDMRVVVARGGWQAMEVPVRPFRTSVGESVAHVLGVRGGVRRVREGEGRKEEEEEEEEER
jgi:hypothetical protein